MKPLHILVTGLFTLGATALMGCGSSPPPTSQVATSSAEIRAAKELDADSVPAAQYYLKLAKDQMSEATQLMNDGQNEKATHVLARAQADAELATALARETKTKKAAEDTQAQLRALQSK
jgi:hypothetical protein